MRILHAPHNIGGMAGVLARAQSSLGHCARAYSTAPDKFQYRADYTLRNRFSIIEKYLTAFRFLWDFDIFHFYFGSSLLDNSFHDLLPLKFLRKKIFFYFCGCDIRDEKATSHQYAISACNHCFPKLCNRNRIKAREAAAHFGRINFVSTPDLLEFMPRSIHLPQAVDLDLIDATLREPEPKRDPNRLVIAHAPTNRQIKGTPFLLETVRALQARGYPMDLLLIENRSHADALRVYRGADIAVDQLLIGSYGLLSAELMALGIPTLAYLRPDLIKHYSEEPPLIQADPTNLERVLKHCVDHRDELANYRKAGPGFARRVHHPESVARRCLEYYQR